MVPCWIADPSPLYYGMQAVDSPQGRQCKDAQLAGEMIAVACACNHIFGGNQVGLSLTLVDVRTNSRYVWAVRINQTCLFIASAEFSAAYFELLIRMEIT